MEDIQEVNNAALEQAADRPHLQRVVQEYIELRDKSTKLTEFLKSNPIAMEMRESEDPEYEMLISQCTAMATYVTILMMRLKHNGLRVI